MGAFLVVLGGAQIRFVYLVWVFLFVRTGDFHARAYVVLPLWFAMQALSAMLEWSGASTGVAYSAHGCAKKTSWPATPADLRACVARPHAEGARIRRARPSAPRRSMAVSAHAAPSDLAHPSLDEVIRHEQRSRRRRLAIWIAILVAVLAASAATTVLLWPRGLPLHERYRTQGVARGPIVRTVSATGRVEARTSVEVGAQVSGRLETITVDYNDRVVQGQLLARFDPDSLRAQAIQAKASVRSARATLRRAKADLDEAKRRLARSRKLWEQGIEPREELDTLESATVLAQASVDQAAAQLALQEASAELASTNLGYAEIRAPISGVVISRNVEVGQTLASTLQTPVLFVIAEDLAKMRVVASVDEADVGEVKPGQDATFTVDAFPGRRFEALVGQLRSAPIIDQNVVTYEAVLDVDNPELLLRPGMTASIEIETAAVIDAVQVPNASLRFTPTGFEEDAQHHTVWVLRDDTLVGLHVAPGVTDGTVTQVVGDDPFLPGDEIVVDLSPEGRQEAEEDE